MSVDSSTSSCMTSAPPSSMDSVGDVGSGSTDTDPSGATRMRYPHASQSFCAMVRAVSPDSA